MPLALVVILAMVSLHILALLLDVAFTFNTGVIIDLVLSHTCRFRVSAIKFGCKDLSKMLKDRGSFKSKHYILSLSTTNHAL